MLWQTVLQYCYCYFILCIILSSYQPFHFIVACINFQIFNYTNGPWSLHEGDALFGESFSVLLSLFVVIVTCTVAVPWLYWHSSSLRISSLNQIVYHIGTIRYKHECSTRMYGHHMYCMYVSHVHVNVLHVQYALNILCCMYCMYCMHRIYCLYTLQIIIIFLLTIIVSSCSCSNCLTSLLTFITCND